MSVDEDNNAEFEKWWRDQFRGNLWAMLQRMATEKEGHKGWALAGWNAARARLDKGE